VSPARLSARRIERSLDVAVQGSHDTDARKHRWAAERRHQDQAPQRSGFTFAELRSLRIDEIAAQTQGAGDRSISGGCRRSRAMSPFEARAENIGSVGAFPGLTQLRHWPHPAAALLMPVRCSSRSFASAAGAACLSRWASAIAARSRADSASVRSVWYRVTMRLCCRRVVGVHMANPSWFKKPFGITAAADESIFQKLPLTRAEGTELGHRRLAPRDRSRAAQFRCWHV
jgi:hypothetical protein